MCVSESDQYWFRYWLVAYLALSHFLNQCWFIVNWTLRNKLEWNFNQNTKLFIRGNAYENIVCEMAATLSGSGGWFKAPINNHFHYQLPLLVIFSSFPFPSPHLPFFCYFNRKCIIQGLVISLGRWNLPGSPLFRITKHLWCSHTNWTNSWIETQWNSLKRTLSASSVYVWYYISIFSLLIPGRPLFLVTEHLMKSVLIITQIT